MDPLFSEYIDVWLVDTEKLVNELLEVVASNPQSLTYAQRLFITRLTWRLSAFGVSDEGHNLNGQKSGPT